LPRYSAFSIPINSDRVARHAGPRQASSATSVSDSFIVWISYGGMSGAIAATLARIARTCAVVPSSLPTMR